MERLERAEALYPPTGVSVAFRTCKHTIQAMGKTAKPERKRGRPFEFSPDEALETALSLFWRHGYAATSLDMIAQATGTARPSLARVFGDKLGIYLKCLERFRGRLRRTLGTMLQGDEPIDEALEAFCVATIKLYMTGGAHPLGCLIINTAPSAAVDAPDVRKVLSESLTELDLALGRRLRAAAARGEIRSETDIASVAYLIAGLTHSLAVRARAGESERSLRKCARAAIQQLLR